MACPPEAAGIAHIEPDGGGDVDEAAGAGHQEKTPDVARAGAQCQNRPGAAAQDEGGDGCCQRQEEDGNPKSQKSQRQDADGGELDVEPVYVEWHGGTVPTAKDGGHRKAGEGQGRDDAGQHHRPAKDEIFRKRPSDQGGGSGHQSHLRTGRGKVQQSNGGGDQHEQADRDKHFTDIVGDDEALALGINVRRVRLIVVLAATLGTASVVAVTGLIGFVGIIVPHAVRLIVGASNRVVLPMSMMLGAAFLVAADIPSRVLASPAETPIGVVTAFIGAPFFLLLLRTRDVSR